MEKLTSPDRVIELSRKAKDIANDVGYTLCRIADERDQLKAENRRLKRELAEAQDTDAQESFKAAQCSACGKRVNKLIGVCEDCADTAEYAVKYEPEAQQPDTLPDVEWEVNGTLTHSRINQLQAIVTENRNAIRNHKALHDALAAKVCALEMRVEKGDK